MNTQIGILQSVQVGRPERHVDHNENSTRGPKYAWETSFFRVPGPQPRWLYTTHLEGNAQADTANHGRLDQAVLLYAAAHYLIWQTELRHAEIGPGGFGENLTIAGLCEEEIKVIRGDCCQSPLVSIYTGNRVEDVSWNIVSSTHPAWHGLTCRWL